MVNSVEISNFAVVEKNNNYRCYETRNNNTANRF